MAVYNNTSNGEPGKDAIIRVCETLSWPGHNVPQA